MVVLPLLAWPTIAIASDKPMYQPAPAWVKPSPPIDATKLTDASPLLLVYDNQQKLEKGEVWTYVETAARVATTQALTALGTIQLPWQPDHGDLIIHKIEIIRGTEHIDLINGGQPFTVLRREQQLNKLVLDGTLTATLPVEGLRVGDVLHMMVSVTLKDATLKGRVQTGALLLRQPVQLQFGRQRLIWPQADTVRWKDYSGTTITPAVVANGYRELTLTLPLDKEPETPKDAPLRFKPIPLLEATDFADWAQVAATMAPLYATDGLIDPKGPIAAEVNRIMAASPDPLTRAAVALQLVQDKIRYQLIALNTGNYVPQTPAQTWSLRYGDCKAKTLLLLAMLRTMGITAEPVLASIQLSDLVGQRLPSASAFDHVLVRAEINGEDLWLDGTDLGARLADIHDVPPLGAVLPLRTKGAGLITLPRRAPARPSIAPSITFDSSAGINLPATFNATITFRGALTEQMRLLVAQANRDEVDKVVNEFVSQVVNNAAIDTHSVTFDDALGTATINAHGVGYPEWKREDERFKLVLDATVDHIDFSPDRARIAWQQMPVKIANADRQHGITQYLLPHGGTGFVIEGSAKLDAPVAGNRVVRTATLNNGLITVEVDRSSAGGEIGPADIGAARQQLATVQAQTLRAIAPIDYPGWWQEVVEAKRDHKTDAAISVYTRRITEKPDQADRYTDRAWYFERIYDRDRAIADLSKALTLSADADVYLRRADLYRDLNDLPKALADAQKAHDLDPKSSDAIVKLADIKSLMGDTKGALALLQERIDQATDDRLAFVKAKAETQADGGDVPAGIATLDEAIAKSPGRPDLLNARCWMKATHNIAIDTALRDCTKAIELSDSPETSLDSRAMAYFRLNRFDDALADLNAALTRAPDQAGSLYLRGIIRKQQGDAAAATVDLGAAVGMTPTIVAEYKRFGITP